MSYLKNTNCRVCNAPMLATKPAWFHVCAKCNAKRVEREKRDKLAKEQQR